MNIQGARAVRAYRYGICPFDGTFYQFMIAHYDEQDPARSIITNRLQDGDIVTVGQTEPEISHVSSGINAHGYITLTICMSSGQGSYEVMKEAIRDPHRGFIYYLYSHMASNVYLPSLVACVLAASVLVDEPMNLDAAYRRAGKWAEFMDAEGIEMRQQ